MIRCILFKNGKTRNVAVKKSMGSMLFLIIVRQ